MLKIDPLALLRGGLFADRIRRVVDLVDLVVLAGLDQIVGPREAVPIDVFPEDRPVAGLAQRPVLSEAEIRHAGTRERLEPHNKNPLPCLDAVAVCADVVSLGKACAARPSRPSEDP